MIEDALLDSIRGSGFEPTKVAKDKYKLKFYITTKDQGGYENKVYI